MKKVLWLYLLLIMFAGQALAQDVVGSISRLEGQADVIRGGGSPQALAVGDDIFRADELITRDESLTEVQFSDGSSVILDENSKVTIAQYAPSAAPRGLLQLARGRLRNSVSGVFSGRADSYQVQTREGVMGVQGTEFEVVALAGETLVFVYEGLVSARSVDPAFPELRMLSPGEFMRIRLGEPIQPPGRFFGVAGRGKNPIGSGGTQALVSDGNQAGDPTVTVPSAPDQRDNEVVVVPPDPNPPSQR